MKLSKYGILSALMMLLASELRVKQEDIQSLRITRHSLDARDKADIRSIYSVSFELSTENAKRVALLGLKNVGKLPERSEREPEQGTVPQDAPAVVVGLECFHASQGARFVSSLQPNGAVDSGQVGASQCRTRFV